MTEHRGSPVRRPHRPSVLTSGSDRATAVLRELHVCLGETARTLASERPTARARAAQAAVEQARTALVPLLQPAGGADLPGTLAPVERSVALPADATAARRARAFCRDALAAWALPPAAEAAVDVASELVTNAARAAHAPVELRLALTDDELRVSTWDDGPGRPRLLPYRPGRSDRGMGLHWVDALSAAWGWQEEGLGKRVWASVRLDG